MRNYEDERLLATLIVDPETYYLSQMDENNTSICCQAADVLGLRIYLGNPDCFKEGA